VAAHLGRHDRGRLRRPGRSGDTRIVAFLGAGIIFFGSNLWVPATFGVLMLISGFLVVAAVLAMFGVETRGRRFEEVSP
jgi:type IV secretory pathway TrbD component